LFLACCWSAVVDMSHTLVYAQQGGWERASLSAVNPRSLSAVKKGMDEPVTDCTWNMNIINSHCVFLALKDQNWLTAHAYKHNFLNLSHTPANRNECPCCKHFLTTPANTSILSLSLKNQNFKFVTLTRAPSQPVALFYAFDPCTNTPGLGPSTIYSLSINKLSHWRCGVPCQVWLPEETFFFSGCLDLMILCVFGPD
jgi:hypothetical protein